MDGSRDEPPGCGIDRLPDECLQSILSWVSNELLLIPEIREDARVDYPAVCALVCKRWRRLSKPAVRTLAVGDIHLSQTLARDLGARFNSITALTFMGSQLLAGDPLGTLADLTPWLERLELQGIRSLVSPSLFSDMAHALTKWTHLQSLNIADQLWTATSEESRATFDAITALPSLRHLTFCYRNPDLPDVCARLAAEIPSLTSLHLMCTCLPPECSSPRLPFLLRELELREIRENYIPESLSLFTNLSSLSLDNADGLTDLPESLGSLSRLSCLEILRCERLKSLPDTLGRLTSLESFFVGWCPALEMWPTSVAALIKLRKLRVRHCPAFPQSLGASLTSLESLMIKSRSLTLPQSIGDIPNLRLLDLRDCYEWLELPESFTRLGGLRSLRIRSCPGLGPLPPALGLLSSLTELEISYTQIQGEALPASLSQLTNLEVCKIGGLVRLAALPEGIGALLRLSRLEVSRCPRLEALPDGISRLKGLRQLTIGQCASLAALPGTIGGLVHLEVLCLVECIMISELPEGMGEMVGLRSLTVSGCMALTSLPENLARLTGLEVLRLSCNHSLNSLPAGVYELPALRLLKSQRKRMGVLRWWEVELGSSWELEVEEGD